MTAARGAGPLAVESPRRFTLAIDPGPVESGWVTLADDDRRPLDHGKTKNETILRTLSTVLRIMPIDRVVIEMIASYGMAVGAEVFETCVWIGRFEQVARDGGRRPARIKRQPVKVHHCHSGKATDANVTQALVDRFAPGQPNRGKGTKAAPGWFHGFSGDVWQAYALGVYAIDEDVW